jgi:hypothetical protein
MSCKRYTEEFKVEAGKQVTERGHPCRSGMSAGSDELQLVLMDQTMQRVAGTAGCIEGAVGRGAPPEGGVEARD